MKKILVRAGFAVALTAASVSGFTHFDSASPGTPQATKQWCC